MSRFPVASLALAAMAMTLSVLVPAAYAEPIKEVVKFNGTITDVGVVRGPEQTGGVEYRIKGKFIYTGPIDLTLSTFTIDKWFVEVDSLAPAPVCEGAGELMRQSQGLDGPETDPPLADTAASTLLSNHGEPDEAKYDSSPASSRPQIRVKVKIKEEGLFVFDVRLDRGMMRDRPLCCTLEFDGRTRTSITIGFTIDDGINPPVVVETTKKWECPQPGRYHLRSR